MNKSELVREMSSKVEGGTIKESVAYLEAFIETIEETVAKGEKVQLVGFGTFEAKERASRIGRNPRTQEEITIPASVVPIFKAGKEFKQKVDVK